MQLGDKGTELIQRFEKLEYTSYPDQGGVWTIGWGHTGPDVTAGLTCTGDQADAWFRQDTAKAVRAVLSSVDVAICQNQFDALVAFTYNVGVGAEAHSTLVKYVNANRFDLAALEFLKWNHVNGQVSNGLTRRRQAEHDLFLATA